MPKLKPTLLAIIISALTVLSLTAQTGPGETPVAILGGMSTGSLNCFPREGNAVIDEVRFNEFIRTEGCAGLKDTLGVDFERQTLIAYRVGGDCRMSLSTAVFRNDTEKKYRVRLDNIWGGCRAGGSVQGWLRLDKIPADYRVEFQVNLLEEKDLPDSDGSLISTGKRVSTLEPLPVREVELKGCIQTIFNKEYVIRTKPAFLEAIRSDASRPFCLENLEEIDFEKETLLGIEINSGYCQRPLGLEFGAARDDAAKQYVFAISYTDPKDVVCRALSQYDLWVLVPKLPDDYEVKFTVGPETTEVR